MIGDAKKVAQGLAASPGSAVGIAVFDADTAAERGKTEKVILVRDETNPDDVHGMLASQGIVTARGGRLRVVTAYPANARQRRLYTKE